MVLDVKYPALVPGGTCENQQGQFRHTDELRVARTMRAGTLYFWLLYGGMGAGLGVLIVGSILLWHLSGRFKGKANPPRVVIPGENRMTVDDHPEIDEPER